MGRAGHGVLGDPEAGAKKRETKSNVSDRLVTITPRNRKRARAQPKSGARPRTVGLGLRNSTRRSIPFEPHEHDLGAGAARTSPAGRGRLGRRRDAGEVQLDLAATSHGGERPLPRREPGGGSRLARMAFFPQDVGRGQCGVAAEIDLDRRGEPAQLVGRLGVEPEEEGRLGEVHLAGHLLHPLGGGGFGEDADGRRVAGERAIGERIDDGDSLTGIVGPIGRASRDTRAELARAPCRRHPGDAGGSPGGQVRHLAERVLQVDVQLAIDRVRPLVDSFRRGVDGGGLDDLDRRVACLGHRGKAAGPDLRQQRDAERRPFARVDRADILPIDVGLDPLP